MKRVLFVLAGVVLAAALWTLPWRDYGLQPFALHMLRHVSLVALVAPLFVAALPSRPLPVSPLAATVAEFVVVWGWHLPLPHQAAATNHIVLAVEQLSYLAVGLFFWAGAVRGENRLAGAGGMLLTSMHMTLLGALLVLAPRPLYAAICFAADPLADQRVGGMLMLAVATPVYLVAGLRLVYCALEDIGGERARL